MSKLDELYRLHHLLDGGVPAFPAPRSLVSTAFRVPPLSIARPRSVGLL